MKPFNLEEAKRGKPVQTRDGLPVKIIDYSSKNINFPLVAYINNQVLEVYTDSGTVHKSKKECASDLFMADISITGYLNIYRDGSSVLHPSRIAADINAIHSRIACIKIKAVEGQFDE